MMSGVGVAPAALLGPAPGDAPACPFVGLMPFREEDERFFFGRDRERDLISANLAASRLTILYARSGAGKTSVLRAGVLPQAWRGNQEMLDDLGTPGFITAYVRQWSIDAHAAITQAVRVAVARTPGARPVPDSPVATLAPEWFHAVIEGTGCAGIRLILDQFEEYFLYNPVEPASGGIVDALAALVRDDRLAVHVMLSLREESLASLDRFKARIPELFANVLRLEPLTAGAARDAVLRPVEAYNELVDPADRMSVEPELLDLLLAEVHQGRIDAAGGALVGPGAGAGPGLPRDAIESPYLQLVLTKLWAAERAVGSPALRRSTLVDLGGAESIVRRHLDEVMADLPASDRELAAAAFHHLVTPSGAKVALSAADLAEWTTWPLSQVQELLDELGSGAQRIVRAVPPPQGVAGPTRYEIYHDVLALAVADWRKRYDASRAAAQLVREREEALALASATRRRLRRTRLVAIGLGALLLAIGALSLLALKLQGDVRTQEALRATLLEAEQLLSSDPTQSLRLAVDADARTGDEETAEAVLKASGALRYEMVTDPAWCPAERPCGADHVLVTSDGERIVILDTSGDTVWLTVRSVEDPATGEWVRADLSSESLADEVITQASVNEDASLVGVATRTEAFVVSTGTGIATGMDVGGEELYDMEFLTGPDDVDQVAVSEWDGIRVLDAGTGQVVRRLDVEAPWSTAVVADTVVALDSGDRRLKVWGADDSAPLFASDPIPDDLRLDQVLLAAAPGLAVAATGAMNEPMVLLVWRWEEGTALGRHQGSIMKAVNDLSIDEKQWFATVASDKTARQFDLRTPAWRPALPQHSDWVYSAVTVRRGKRILTAGADGAIHYWSTVTPSWATSSSRHPVYELLGHAGAALDIATVGPTDRVVVSTGVDRTARIWRLPETRRYEQHRDWVIGLEASSGESCRAVQAGDGDECVVTVSSDHAALHRLRVDAASPAEVDFATQKGVLEPPEGRLLRQVLLRTGPDVREGIVLYEESAPPELWRWDPEQPDLPARFVRTFDAVPDGAPVDSLSLSADGSMVAGGDSRGRIHVWDVDTGERWEYTLGRRGTTSGLTFDPTGGWVALTTGGGVQLGDWDADPAPDPVDLPCPDDARGCTLGAVHSVFSGDGSRVAVSTWRGEIHVWDTGGEHIVGPLALPGLSSSRPALSADGRLLAAGTDDGLIQVWDIGTGRVVFRVRRHADSVNAVLFAMRPGDGAGPGAQAVRESLLISVSDDTTAAVIPCAPCADAERAVDEMRVWVDSHPGEGSSGRPAG